MIKICLTFGRKGYSLGDYVGMDCFGAGYTSRYKYFIVLSHVSGVLLFGGKINYFGGIGYPPGQFLSNCDAQCRCQFQS